MTLSANMLSALAARETGEVLAMLVQITHVDLPTPLRVNNTGANLTSNSEVFTNTPFDIELPTDESGTVRESTLTIDNIDQSVAATLANLVEPATIKVQIVLVSTPDVIEREWDNFLLTDVKINQFTISGTFAVDGLLNKAIPRRRFTPNAAPGLFQ